MSEQNIMPVTGGGLFSQILYHTSIPPPTHPSSSLGTGTNPDEHTPGFPAWVNHVP
ncbi:TPA: hypothetical protein HA338_06260 [Methanosarcina acetivorans]|uniref:Uncharacterized protein n=1 Tax=Methanosarcina acetivorans TaxID=2214 RepID=A0A832SI33_9EURY|nr:hypothetical protein [Methanosarcina acetivorans]HIH93643.1 hypothetical protein [Methanosarcina acetivorans]